jgi:hypothetical protein
MARREVKKILGKFSWDATEPYLSFGPGASVGLRRRYSHPFYKIGHNEPTTTGENFAVDAAFIDSVPLWKRFREANSVNPKVVVGSKIVTVPKDARTDRVIAIEPQLNMFFQKGIGGLIRRRLLKAGCDLNDQTMNQRLALLGSQTGHLATIDLANASDSISRVLVEQLLPEEWLLPLKCVRCTHTDFPSDGEKDSSPTYKGKSTPWFLQKFSSMGNGYTFELESLIFLALGRACARYYGVVDQTVSVYGDDIVVGTDLAPHYISLLAEVGFKTNTDKTFVTGSFRESCGKHYFAGSDVTPYYLKHKIDSQESVLKYANSIRRLAHRLLGGTWGCDAALRATWLRSLDALSPSVASLSIPEGFGDGGVVRDFDEVCPAPNVRKNWVEGYTTSHLVRKYASRRCSGEGLLVLGLHALEKRALALDGTNIPVTWDARVPEGCDQPTLGGSRTLLKFRKLLKEVEAVLRLEKLGDISLVETPRYILKRKKLQITQWPSLGPWAV